MESFSGGISMLLFSAGTESRKFTFHFQVSLQLFSCVQSSLRVTALSLKEILSTLSKTPSFSVCRPTPEKPLQLFYKGHSSRAKRRSSGNHKWTRFGNKVSTFSNHKSAVSFRYLWQVAHSQFVREHCSREEIGNLQCQSRAVLVLVWYQIANLIGIQRKKDRTVTERIMHVLELVT